MQQRLSVLLEVARVEGKVKQCNNASILKSLGKVTSEVPFFNVPLTNVPHKTLMMLSTWLLMAQIWVLFIFSNLKNKNKFKLLNM
jgi:hypothetical protein